MTRVEVVAETGSGPVRPAGWLRQRSWVVEIGVFVGLVLVYNVVRATGGTDASAAYANARALVALEGPLLEHLALPLNLGLTQWTMLAVAACYVYALLHYALTPAVLLLSRRRGGWHYWRGYWALVVASAIALAVYATFPVAPPRLVPGLPVVDVMREFADYGWWGSAASAPRGIGDATNQFAAMPSMHCGWAMWCGIQLWHAGSMPARVVAVAYPSLVAVVVVATGNHFVLDIVGGALCVAVAYAAVEVAGRLTRRSDPLRASAGRW